MFDRFASLISRQVARAWFFTACCLLVLLWGPSIFVIKDTNLWELLINTVTTIVTFLLVALLQNGQAALEQRIDARLQVILDVLNHDDPCPPEDDPHQD